MANQEKKVKFSHSMRMRILRVVAVGTLFTCVAILLIIIPLVKSNLKITTKGSMQGVIESYEKLIEKEYEANPNMGYADYKDLLGEAGLEHVESSYIYLVDASGTMLYHPTEEKVGQPVENEVVKGLVADIA